MWDVGVEVGVVCLGDTAPPGWVPAQEPVGVMLHLPHGGMWWTQRLNALHTHGSFSGKTRKPRLVWTGTWSVIQQWVLSCDEKPNAAIIC